MNLSNSESDADMNLKSLECLIKEEQKNLEEDRLKFQRNIENNKKRHSDGNYNQHLQYEVNHGPPNYLDINGQVKERFLLRDKSKVFMIKNRREEEINKLIDKISKPKEQQSFTNNRQLRRSYPQEKNNCNQLYCPINIREREKDQLSEKLALSECPFTKPSSRQIAKNLYSSIYFNDYKQNNLVKAIDKPAVENVKKGYFNVGEGIAIDEDKEEYLRKKYNCPRIVISECKENIEEFGDSENNKMVRIGEFSPLNPNLPGGTTVLGLGEWDEKRQFLLEKYRQVSRSPSPSQCDGGHDRELRSVATQTDLDEVWSPNLSSDRSQQNVYQTLVKSPQPLCRQDNENNDTRCASSQFRESPILNRFENMNEKEIKEYIYRQELARQIEEKNRLKEKIKKKEAEEEAKLEAKIKRDLEKMRLEYDKERLQQLELALKRKEQDDFLRQRLAIEQQKSSQETKITKKRPAKDSALQNLARQFEKSTQSDFEISEKVDRTRIPYSRSLPDQSAASFLSSVQNELQQPLRLASSIAPEVLLSEKRSPKRQSPSPKEIEKRALNTSKSPPIPSHRCEEVDILAQRAVFDTNVKSSPRTKSSAFLPDSVRDKLKEVDILLKQPLLPEDRVLPPVSQPLIHATIPPLSSSLQTSQGASLNASRRTNADVLEDKWKVPHTEDTSAANTKHSAHILTQLGTFRRHLQEESLRMRQRVREDSP